MTKLSDLNIKAVYDTDDDVKQFYNEVLSCANEYRRASAYFSDGFYSYIEKGLTQLIKCGGKMKLILSTEIDGQSLDAIKQGYALKENKTDFINQCIKNSVFDFEKVKDEMSLISYLIAIDKLDIRFVFKQEGLYHDKYSIITDSNNNILLLSGSNNETAASVLKNHESFETTLSWNNPSQHEIEKIQSRIQKFEDTWNDNVSSLVVLPMTEVIKEKLIDDIDYDKISKTIPEFDFIRLSIDADNKIRIQTNVNLDLLVSEYRYQNLIKYFVESLSDTCIRLKPLSSVNDVVDVKNVFEYIANKINAKLIITASLKDYLNKYYLDLKTLSIVGNNIKDKSVLAEDTEFLHFCTKIQMLLNRPLKTAQLQAAYHICKLRRAMNFSVPGSGKTSSILGAFEYLHSLNETDPNHIDRILVLGPLNCFKAWKEEYAIVSKRYSKDDITKIIDIKEVGDNSAKSTLLKYDFQKAEIVLVNFDVVTKLSSILSMLVDERTMVVFDEIHRIKNYESDKLPACLKIVDKSNFRVALTGTPLPNGYKDLFSMFNLLFGDLAKFYFGMHIDELQRADKDFEENGIESQTINDRIFPFYVRVSKDDLEVPKANEDHLIYVEMNDYEQSVYDSILSSSSTSFGKTIRLVEVGCIPEIASSGLETSKIEEELFTGEDVDEESFNSFNSSSTSKINSLLNVLKDINGKCVIWCTFTSTIEKVYQILKSKYKIEKIYGVTPQEERTEIIDRFNNTNEIDIIITNPHTLAESVSLHKACHNAIYLELNYNLAQYLQSRDRIHRLGLSKDQETDYYIFIEEYNNDLEASIDYLIYKRLCKKEKRMKNAIDRGALLYKDEFNPKELDDIISDITKKVFKK